MLAKEPDIKDSGGREPRAVPEPKSEIPVGQRIGRLYAMATLDCIVQMAEGIAHDFRITDELYNDINSATRKALRKDVGNPDFWEDKEERARIYDRTLTRSDVQPPENSGLSKIPLLTRNLRQAATKWAERKEMAVKDAYLTQVRDAASSLKEYLDQREDSAQVLDAMDTLRPIFDTALKILLDETMIRSFPGAGPRPEAGDGFPFRGPNGKAERLVNAVKRRLAAQHLLDENTVTTLQEGKFSLLLQIAHLGERTINLVLNKDWDKKIEEIAVAAFSWESAISQFHAGR